MRRPPVSARPEVTLEPASPHRSELQSYLDIVRRRRLSIVLTFVVVAAATVAGLLVQPPTYTAATRVLLETEGSLTDDVLRQFLVGERELVTQREIILSDPVLEDAAEAAGVDLPPSDLRGRISVDVIDDTAVLEIGASAGTRGGAAGLATSVARSYLEFSRQEALDRLVRAAASIEERESAAQAQLREVERDLRSATDDDRQALLFQQQQLQAEIAGLRQQRTSLSASADDVGGIGRIVREATPPSSPAGQGLVGTLAVAVALGLGAALGLAFLREYFDDRVRSSHDAAELTGRPVLARIGPLPRRPGTAGLVDEFSGPAEGYRILRTALRSAAVDQGRPSLLVTSSSEGEGKSTTVANLAASLARAGQRTLLVDADLRNPVLGSVFDLSGAGLSDVLLGDAELDDVVQRVGVDNLRVITSGGSVPNPAELLGSDRMTQVVGQLESMADVVLFDAPAVLSVADGLEVARRVTGVVLVVDAKLSQRSSLSHALERLTAAPGHVVGLVMNRTPADDTYGAYADARSNV